MTTTIFRFDNAAQNSTQDNVMRLPLIRGATSVAYAYTRARRNKVGRAFP